VIYLGGLYPNDDKCVAYTYGSDPIQVIDCHLPKGPYVPLVVLLIHGGYWSAKLNRSIENAVGNDLLRFNIVVCNLDYRSVGNGGGYPNTFYDVANGTDLLRTIAQEHGFNSSRVIVVGHSAGGQLGGYITGRFRLLPTQPGYSTDPLRPIAYVSQAGVNNMWDGCDQAAETGSGAVISFLGGTYQIFPERYVLSSLAASSNLTVRFVNTFYQHSLSDFLGNAREKISSCQFKIDFIDLEHIIQVNSCLWKYQYKLLLDQQISLYRSVKQ
jgi:pimeloyl-ACP methyl ester carboxylesterase